MQPDKACYNVDTEHTIRDSEEPARRRTGERTALAVEPENLRVIPGTHVVEGENQLLQVDL